MEDFTFIFFIAIAGIVLWIQDLRTSLKRTEKEYKSLNEKHRKLSDSHRRLCNDHETLHKHHEEAKRSNGNLRKLLFTKNPFSDVASMKADIDIITFDDDAKYLKDKVRPAIKAAAIVQEVKGKYRILERENLVLRYKYDFILKLFPELNQYVEDESSSIDLKGSISIEQLQDEYDRTRDYISPEEYKSMGECERNQLALDNYKRRRRSSSWVAGVEYEMYYCYKLKNEGFAVIDFGVQKKLEDLGRDIIAYKNGKTYIIQCKRYGQNKYVHENTICQLYGTTLHYKITQRETFLFSNPEKIFPVLVTTGELSDTAKEFARKLGVIVRIVPMGEYPMIKCNINGGNKIYHLPFDQQYWNTKIDKEGEFCAFTVKEAMDNGFRRAYKWKG